MCKKKLKLHVLSKLHGKMFITRNILHVFICIVILLLFKCKQTSMSKVILSILLFGVISV